MSASSRSAATDGPSRGWPSGGRCPADGLTWRFTLRRGLVFQDGEPITSTAARTAIVAASAGAPESETLPPGLRDLVAVETPTPHGDRHPPEAAERVPARSA